MSILNRRWEIIFFRLNRIRCVQHGCFVYMYFFSLFEPTPATLGACAYFSVRFNKY